MDAENTGGAMSPELRRNISILWSGNLIAPFLLAGVSAMLPAMGDTLGASAVGLSLVMVFYNLGQTIAQLLGGRLGALFGIRRVLMWSMYLFIALLALMAVTPSIGVAVGLRFGQGVAAGAVSCCVTALSVLIAPPRMRARVMGIVVTSVYLGLTMGPFVCGTLTELTGWRTVFILITAAAALLCPGIMKLPADEAAAPGGGMDAACVMLLIAGVTAVTCGATCGFLHPLVWMLMPAGAVLLGLYLRREWTAPRPLLERRELSSVPGFATGLLAMFANYGAVMGLGLFFSLYLQQVLGYSAMQAGLTLMVQSAVQVAVSPPAGRAADRIGAEKVVLAALVIYLAGLGSLFLLDASSPLWLVVLCQAVLGLGCGGFAAPNMSATLASVPRAKMSVASGCVGCMRTFGGLMSQITLSAIMGLYMGSAKVGPGTEGLFLDSMRMTFAVYMSFTIAAVAVAAWRVIGRPKG
ncbi:MAG: MFS transporter [Mailhella sp.]|nr:MFS transporter [Mailhella sp.]